MQRTGRATGWAGGERGTTTFEWAGIAAAVAVLLGAAGAGLAGQGGPLAGAIGTRLAAATDGEPRRWRDTREVRRGGGTIPVRVSRDELRMSPFLDERAVASGSRTWTGERGGVRASATVRGCLLCASAEWSHGMGPAAGVGPDGAHAGIGGGVEASARAAIASAEVGARAERDLGTAAGAFAQGRLRATLGAEADGTARLHVAPGVVDAEVDGGAMVGAVARAEARAGVDLLGISIRQSGRAEGWAGAGIRGTAGVRRTPGVTSWRVGWGGALGLGGATEWSGTVDASAVPVRHRRLAGAVVTSLLRSSLGLTVLPVVPLTSEEP